MPVSSLTDFWSRLVGVQSGPPRLVVLGAAVLAIAVIGPYRSWRITRHVVTIAHEGGHALTALLTGRRLSAIRLHSDTSGLTVSAGRPTGPGMVATGMAGYLTPSLLGLLGAVLLTSGRITVMLWTALAVLAAMLVMIRNVFGVVSVVTTIGIVFAVSWFTSAQVQAAFAYFAVWLLLAGGVRPIVELQRMRRRGQAPYSDADQLARLTRLPGLFWVAFFWVGTVAALLVGGWLLLRPMTEGWA
ncbi:M50 family metallopeptidase [Planosporangium flavigriseum]|uniref:M50 family metallopeptidase n=1 Tax=Planosporangium flavigriseum TaxID=373681 RepID=UPI00143B137D|nr:M50 family metallopeptidase [Planosporangium flavigriseum]